MIVIIISSSVAMITISITISIIITIIITSTIITTSTTINDNDNNHIMIAMVTGVLLAGGGRPRAEAQSPPRAAA